jgi:hypothetical protein
MGDGAVWAPMRQRGCGGDGRGDAGGTAEGMRAAMVMRWQCAAWATTERGTAARGTAMAVRFRLSFLCALRPSSSFSGSRMEKGRGGARVI